MLNKKMLTSLSKYLSILFLTGVLVVLTTGCEKKTEKPGGENNTVDTTSTTQTEQTPADTMETEYPDLVGTWTGKFESHTATFKVTGQDGGDFSASLTVAYREPMNKTISGIIDPATNTITMKDDVKSRNESSYTAELTEDGKKITGVSTLKINGNKANFTFTKK
jgi:PBP1b-binding outer membrane lipoprotein LpoB